MVLYDPPHPNHPNHPLHTPGYPRVCGRIDFKNVKHYNMTETNTKAYVQMPKPSREQMERAVKLLQNYTQSSLLGKVPSYALDHQSRIFLNHITTLQL